MRTQLRETLELAVANPWPAAEWNPGAEPRDVLLGVLANDVRLAVRALRDWTQALGVPMVPIECRVRVPLRVRSFCVKSTVLPHLLGHLFLSTCTGC